MSSVADHGGSSSAVEVGQTWVDPETGVGWSVTQIDSDGGITAEAVVEQTFCDAADLQRDLILDVADHG